MKRDLETFIQKNIDGVNSRMPDGAILNRILKELKPAKASASYSRLLFFPAAWYAAAAAILAIISVLIFLNLQTKPAGRTAATAVAFQKKQLPEQNTDDKVQAAPVKHNAGGGIAKATKKPVLIHPLSHAWSSGNTQSVADRLRYVNAIGEQRTHVNGTIDTLISILSHDKSANVRLAALDELTPFLDSGYVRKHMAASLKKQQDPLVQMRLIGLLTNVKETCILSDLDDIISSEKYAKVVRDLAYVSIWQLRS